jgi:O-methyltransferase involved in polyketide biosynthesis
MANIESVSDTARWVAVYRAMETARPDAIFRDPCAEWLASEHGVRIVGRFMSARRRAAMARMSGIPLLQRIDN